MTISEPFQTNPIGIDPGGAVLGEVGQAGQVAGQEFLADRTVQDVGDLARLHDQTPLSTVVISTAPA
jgi:hypothetical protein